MTHPWDDLYIYLHANPSKSTKCRYREIIWMILDLMGTVYSVDSRKYSHVIMIIIHQCFVILRLNYRKHIFWGGTAKNHICIHQLNSCGWFRAIRPYPGSGTPEIYRVRSRIIYDGKGIFTRAKPILSSGVNKHSNKEIHLTFSILKKLVHWFTKEYRPYLPITIWFYWEESFANLRPFWSRNTPKMVLYFQTNPVPYWFCVVQTISFSGVQSGRGLWQFFQKLWFCITSSLSDAGSSCNIPWKFLEIRDVKHVKPWNLVVTIHHISLLHSSNPPTSFCLDNYIYRWNKNATSPRDFPQHQRERRVALSAPSSMAWWHDRWFHLNLPTLSTSSESPPPFPKRSSEAGGSV